jgi:hypothetical protein
MYRILCTISFALIVNMTFGQVSDSVKIKREGFDNYTELRNKQKKAGIDTLFYIDSTFKFQVIVPNWLNLMETGTKYAWGGKLPKTNGIENAILVKSFEKDKFKSLKEFKNYIIEDVKFGNTPKWSSKHKSMGKKDLEPFNQIGSTYKVYWMLGTLIYHCKYVLVETKTAYLWIDFTATNETFDINISKFEVFLKGFKIVE